MAGPGVDCATYSNDGQRRPRFKLIPSKSKRVRLIEGLASEPNERRAREPTSASYLGVWSAAQSLTVKRGISNRSVVRAYQPLPCMRPIKPSAGVFT